MLDFYAGYQIGGSNVPVVTVPLNDNIDYDGGIVTWIDNLAAARSAFVLMALALARRARMHAHLARQRRFSRGIEGISRGSP